MYGDDQHTHSVGDVTDAASDHDLEMLRRDVGSVESDVRNLDQWSNRVDQRMTDAERDVDELQRQVRKLQADLEAERTLNAALRGGAVTVPMLIESLRVTASGHDVSPHVYHALLNLSDAIERGTS
jgi:hypothetical protein